MKIFWFKKRQLEHSKNIFQTLLFFILALFLFSSAFSLKKIYAEEESPEELPGEENQKEIKDKKAELKEAESRTSQYQEKTEALSEKVKTLEEVVREINKEISETEQSLQETQAEIDKVQVSIDSKTQEINGKEKELASKRKILSEYIREIDRLSRQSMVEVFLSSQDLGDYLQDLNSLNKTSGDIQKIYNEIKEYKIMLLEERKNLEAEMENHTALKTMQKQQKFYLENSKAHKDKILEETKGEESRFQKMLAENEIVVNRIYEELTALQSLGTPIDFEDALNAARYASRKTGVREAFLLGVLRVESNMGANVGGGNYNVDMHPAQRNNFEEICEELGYDPDDRPVSRKPCYRDEEGNCTGWGGAMGPAQFMPSTWLGYEKKVEETMGIEHANPWNIRHALVAMGLKLAKIPGVTKGDEKAESKAANMYLAGGNWESFTWYGDRVLAFAKAFEKKIKEEGL
jgi:peptidoglycan hydrolase CwlO-like protein